MRQTMMAAVELAPADRPRGVLILTDRISVRMILRRAFDSLGIEAVVVRTPFQALRWLRERAVELGAVIVDLEHEQVEVLSLLRQLAEEYPELRRTIIRDERRPLLAEVATSFGRADLVLGSDWDSARLQRALRALLG